MAAGASIVHDRRLSENLRLWRTSSLKTRSRNFVPSVLTLALAFTWRPTYLAAHTACHAEGAEGMITGVTLDVHAISSFPVPGIDVCFLRLG